MFFFKEKRMKVFIAITMGSGEASPVKRAIACICEVAHHQVVESIDEAELVVTDSSKDALSVLKENEIVRVAIMTYRSHEEIGARALQRAYVGRVDVCPLLDNENNISVYLIKHQGEVK